MRIRCVFGRGGLCEIYTFNCNTISFRGVIADKMDIRGGYAKPNWTDVLWVQLVLLPYTSVRLVPYGLHISPPTRFKLVKKPKITLKPDKLNMPRKWLF